MLVDPGLETAVGRFIDALTPVMQEVASQVPTIDASKLRLDVQIEAWNLAAAFIDCDGLHTDDELWAFIATFSPMFETQLYKATPADVRKAGMVNGKRAWLDEPSTMLEILAGVDARTGSRHARVYYDRAMLVAHTVASIDSHTSQAELAAIEAYRSMVLVAIETATRWDPLAGGAASPAARATGEAPLPVTVPEEPLDPPRPLEELFAELDELVGLVDVKAEIKLVANLIQVQTLRRSRDLPVMEQSRHLIFTGNPGTGKTTVARLLAQIYRTLEVVEKGHLVEADRASLVAGYVGQTAPKVVAVFDRAEGGVLLIDEAYALIRGGENDFGREAIDTIVKLVEDRRDSVVVIAAGYPEEMVSFVDANPGLRSRFPKTIVFPDYSTDELIAIFDQLEEKSRYETDEKAKAKVRTWLESQPRTKGFGNGRLARNLFEHAVARQATRVVALHEPTDEQLITLTVEDIPDLPDLPEPDDGPEPESVR